MEAEYIDIHTHLSEWSEQTRAIRSVSIGHETLPDTLCSVGLHPWYLNTYTVEEDLQQLEKIARLPQVIAIGECGLDKVCSTPMQLQEFAFTAQIAIACRLQLPIIIHQVRSVNEIIRCLTKANFSAPVIIHGFNKKKEVAHEFLKKGYYLSYGKGLTLPHVAAAFQQTPLDKIFLETDDDGSVTIEQVYQLASSLIGLSVTALQTIIYTNFKRVFQSPVLN